VNWNFWGERKSSAVGEGVGLNPSPGPKGPPSPKGEGLKTRRELFGSFGCWVGLVALGAVVARLTVGWQAGKSGGSVRSFSSRCGDCSAINVCLLPEAEAARAQGVGLVGASRGTPGAGPVRPLCRAGKDAVSG